MAAYEDDTLVIPERYKKMPVSELEEEKGKIWNEIMHSDRPEKKVKQNKKNVIFNF
ncbi:MAG: hypothetical protein IJ468_14005 [Lachnospiraceae bacterium]|nr:hypothetical protein [Lachnospiraceae bacterium]